MLYGLVGIAVAMSFFAGIEFILLLDCEKKCRRFQEKCEILSRMIRNRENRDRIVKELDK